MRRWCAEHKPEYNQNALIHVANNNGLSQGPAYPSRCGRSVWHILAAEATITALAVDMTHGLDESGAADRLALHGENKLAEAQPSPHLAQVRRPVQESPGDRAAICGGTRLNYRQSKGRGGYPGSGGVQCRAGFLPGRPGGARTGAASGGGCRKSKLLLLVPGNVVLLEAGDPELGVGGLCDGENARSAS